MLTHPDTRRQLLRYAFTGLASNALLYVAYLLLAGAGLGHKAAMTTVFCAGVALTFVFNRRWTFGHGGAVPGALLRYACTYVAVYLFNIGMLQLFVDNLGFPHQWVMLVLIFAGAAIIFLLQKYWVFPPAQRPAAG